MGMRMAKATHYIHYSPLILSRVVSLLQEYKKCRSFCCRELDSFHQVSYVYPTFLVTNKQRNSHSCSPNLQIYLVARDVPPGNGLPFIAFVALENMSAKTEFTLDYDPRAAERILARKSKQKAVVPEGAKKCACGAEACRGILS
jgi:SET domain-containing protein